MRTISLSVAWRPASMVVLMAAGLLAACAAGTSSPSPAARSPEQAETAKSTGTPATSTATATATVTTTAPPTAAPATPTAGPSAAAAPFRLTAAAFVDGGSIPRVYTCDGSGESPALAWSGAPAGTAALVLLVEDPDARNFVHWIVLDLAGAAAGSLPRAIAGDATTPGQGRNDFGRVGWGGPCPPSGTHHYRFTLSALAAPLGLAGHPDGTAVRAALGKATILGRATLEATYKRG